MCKIDFTHKDTCIENRLLDDLPDPNLHPTHFLISWKICFLPHPCVNPIHSAHYAPELNMFIGFLQVQNYKERAQLVAKISPRGCSFALFDGSAGVCSCFASASAFWHSNMLSCPGICI